MHILWKYFRQQKWRVLLALALAGVAQLLSLIDPIISGKVRPRLFTSSIFRSDSVMTPDILFVSRLIDRCTVLIFLLNRPVNEPSTRIPITKTGTSNQFFATEYQIKNPIPTMDENSTLMNELMKRSVSVLTFWRIDNVSPLRCSSNS